LTFLPGTPRALSQTEEGLAEHLRHVAVQCVLLLAAVAFWVCRNLEYLVCKRSVSIILCRSMPSHRRGIMFIFTTPR